MDLSETSTTCKSEEEETSATCKREEEETLKKMEGKDNSKSEKSDAMEAGPSGPGAEEALMNKLKNREPWWWNDDVARAIKEKKRRYKEWRRTRYDVDKEIYHESKRAARRAVTKAQETHRKELAINKSRGVLLPGETPKAITEEEWKRRLTSQQYLVTRKSVTEKPFSGEFVDHDSNGIYACVCCGAELFSSDTKFKTECGWPAFSASLDKVDGKTNVSRRPDTSNEMERTEALCNQCNAHLGHVFTDGPQPTGERYCINSVALNFISKPK